MTRELGLVHYADGHVRIGQLSRLMPGYAAEPAAGSRALLLDGARHVWPTVFALPGPVLGHCQVALTPDHFPIVGTLSGMPGIIAVDQLHQRREE